ncbi:MAG: glycoside hydrolase family 15 protein [Alphaproteobacteria bacterium]
MPDLNLAVIGNSIVAALIDRRARVVWYCLPRFDGDPVFSSLLDGTEPEAGFYEITLENFAESRQEYQPNSAILVTTLTDTRGGVVRIVDFAPRFKQHDRIHRPSTLMRRVEPAAGLPVVRVRLRPRFGYGREKPTTTHGSNHIRFVSPGMTLRLTSDAPLAYIESEAPFALTQPLHLILGPDEMLPASIPHMVRDFHERTLDYWIEWVRYLSVPFEWQEAVIRAAITLKLCSFEETGAIVAALTTSIPEAPGTQRNWDYRFCWLRDAYFSVHALNRLGATKTMEDFLRYITTVAAGEANGHLKPVYGILPTESLEERKIPSLKGYRGMGPVRIGNAAQLQVQNDSYGSVVLAAAQMFYDQRLPNRGDVNLFRRLEQLGAKAAERAFEPDAGIWEFRGRQAVHTHSAALCWAACDRLAKIALILGRGERAAHWRREADRIRTRILAEAWNEKIGAFAGTLGGSDTDASLLLLQEIGLVPASDPRFLGTLDFVGRNLRQGHHLFRYRTADDFGTPSTAFTICSFWYIEALAAAGRRDEARDLFEKILACRNHVGLFSEDIDPKTGELWGNFPQTYSLVGLVVAAMRLSKSWEEGFWRGW